MLIKEVNNVDSKIILLICKNRAKLYKMIEQNVSYDKILKQNKTLDKYINIQMSNINKIRS